MSTNTKHTPGPWRASMNLRPVFITAPNSAGPKYRDEIIAQMAGNHKDSLTANAALIAAAPELLAALERFVNEDDGPDAWRQARAAIARARGDK